MWSGDEQDATQTDLLMVHVLIPVTLLQMFRTHSCYCVGERKEGKGRGDGGGRKGEESRQGDKGGAEIRGGREGDAYVGGEGEGGEHVHT